MVKPFLLFMYLHLAQPFRSRLQHLLIKNPENFRPTVNKVLQCSAISFVCQMGCIWIVVIIHVSLHSQHIFGNLYDSFVKPWLKGDLISSDVFTVS